MQRKFKILIVLSLITITFLRPLAICGMESLAPTVIQDQLQAIQKKLCEDRKDWGIMRQHQAIELKPEYYFIQGNPKMTVLLGMAYLHFDNYVFLRNALNTRSAEMRLAGTQILNLLYYYARQTYSQEKEVWSGVLSTTGVTRESEIAKILEESSEYDDEVSKKGQKSYEDYQKILQEVKKQRSQIDTEIKEKYRVDFYPIVILRAQKEKDLITREKEAEKHYKEAMWGTSTASPEYMAELIKQDVERTLGMYEIQYGKPSHLRELFNTYFNQGFMEMVA